MSDTTDAGQGGAGGSLASNPAYLAAWQAATGGPTHEARQSAIRDMEVIAAGGAVGSPVAATAPVTAPSPAYPVGQAREAAAQARAAPPGGYQEAFDRASDPRLYGTARDAALADMEARAAAGELTSAAPAAPAGPPEGYEPAASASEYHTPGLMISDREGYATTVDALAKIGMPAFVGRFMLSEGQAVAHLAADPTAYQLSMQNAQTTLAKVHGGPEALAMTRDARALIAQLPDSLRSNAELLLASAAAIGQAAQLYRLNILRKGA